ncbi:MAG: tRNA (N(6)-L-threonylcarbamoyladenosine(37)-C(2))-methylthiotransferase MtaB [Candidatus Amulumruptor caecigallinarius]|nr:tRNA (N(6)-L-threonylcarbamoyladenosine(37)-C(2))-methylthiotransferase MtaB [Candidatus Amulumruptor caecigallinarius]
MERIQKALKAEFHTLGCKLNFSETSTIGKMLKERGISRVNAGESPDIIIVNTCSVTEMADKKGRQLIRRLTREHPEATVVVTGCYAQLKPAEVASLPGVDIVLGSNEKLRISEFLDTWMKEHRQQIEVTPALDITEFAPSCERGDRTRYFLKVQDGCDYFCTYCTIPFARGRSRSGRISDIVDIACNVASEGGKEIVITGVNIGDFGRNTGEKFFDLLRALDGVEGIMRYRISSIEPNLLTEEIIEWTAGEARAFMPHFHIPLQSGSDTVLKLMNRRYDTALFRSRIDLIRSLIPDAFIGVDVITGARGETAEEWHKSYSFIESLDVAHLHAFPYSERPDTKALNISHTVDAAEKHIRNSRLIELSEAKQAEFIRRNIGSKRPVLWEARAAEGDMMHGFTDNYIRVEAPFDAAKINTITDVELTAGNIAKHQ